MNPMFNGANAMQMLAQLKSNPLGVLRQYGFNAPANVGDPEALIQHLMNSGQVSQQQYNRARQIAQSLGMR